MSKSFLPPSPLKTSVLFIVFNRPETTARVFNAIRQAKPPRLYVSADGARSDKLGEHDLVARVRHIATAVDWPCELITKFRDTNLGCKLAVSDAITWFFEHEDQGIILADDCLPSQSFFWFCEYMLCKFRLDNRVFIISGYNKQQEWFPDKHDYFFSHLGGIWGWASWKRAWDHFDIEMNQLTGMIKHNVFVNTMGKKVGLARQMQMLDAHRMLKSGRINTWDYQWGLARHANNALACVPSRSLICNIGFGDDATHTVTMRSNAVTRTEHPPPYRDNKQVVADSKYDEAFLEINLMRNLKNIFKKWIR